MQTIVIILLLIILSVVVIVIFFPNIINTTSHNLLLLDNCFPGLYAITTKYYPPSPSNWDDLKPKLNGKSVNDINECKNECDKYTECTSYAYDSENKECFMNNTIFATSGGRSGIYLPMYTSCLKEFIKPSSKCFAMVDEKAGLDLLRSESKSVNDINDCKNECDKYTDFKSYSYRSDQKLCWLGTNTTLKNTRPNSYLPMYTSCLK